MNLDYNYNIFESDIEGLRSRTTTYVVANQWNVEGRPVRLGIFLNQDYNFLNNDTFSYSLGLFPPAQMTGWAAEPAISPYLNESG